jgi:hypothetical protein
LHSALLLAVREIRVLSDELLLALLLGSETKQVRRLTVTVRPAVAIPRSTSSCP